MANPFQIDIVAQDRFTRVFKRLNDQASRAVRPITQVSRQVQAIGRELHLEAAFQGLARLSAGASLLTRNLGLSAAPIESLFSVGRAGGVVAGLAAAAAGLVAVTSKFASMGLEVKRTSSNLGVSAELLQRLRGAATQASVSTDDLDASLRGVSNAIYRAFYDGDTRVIGVLQHLGIEIKKNADGSLNLEAAFMGVVRAMARIDDPGARRRLAEVLGIPEGAIPLLQKGQQAIEALGQEADELGAVAGPKALEWSERFAASLGHLEIAAKGAGMRIAQSLLPNLPGLMDRATAALKEPGNKPSAPPDAPHRRGGVTGNDWWKWLNELGGPSARSRGSGKTTKADEDAPDSAASPPPKPAPQGINAGNSEFEMATRYLGGPRDVERELAAFDAGRGLAGGAPGAGAAAAPQQRVDVRVSFDGLPKGATATVKSQTQGVDARVGFSMNRGGH